MGVYKAEGVVLRRRALGEADRVITFYTREHGKVAAAARGVRRGRSRLAGRLEPFTHLRLLLAHGRTLDVVAQAEVVAALAPLRTDLHRFGLAALMGELLDAAVPEREALPALFDRFVAALHLVAEDDALRGALWFALQLVSLAGFEPRLTACARCGRTPGGGVRWSHALGGVVCPGCAGRDPQAVPLRPEEAAALSRLLTAPPAAVPAATPPRPERLLDLLRGYAEHRLEVRLRSPAVMGRFPPP